MVTFKSRRYFFMLIIVIITFFMFSSKRNECIRLLSEYFLIATSIIDLIIENNRNLKGYAFLYVDNPVYPIIKDEEFDLELRAISYQRQAQIYTPQSDLYSISLSPTLLHYLTPKSPTKSIDKFVSKSFIYKNIILTQSLFTEKYCNIKSDLSKIGNNKSHIYKSFKYVVGNSIFDVEDKEMFDNDISHLFITKVTFTEFSYKHFTVFGYYEKGVLYGKNDVFSLGNIHLCNITYHDLMTKEIILKKKQYNILRLAFILFFLITCFTSINKKFTIFLTIVFILLDIRPYRKLNQLSNSFYNNESIINNDYAL